MLIKSLISCPAHYLSWVFLVFSLLAANITTAGETNATLAKQRFQKIIGLLANEEYENIKNYIHPQGLSAGDLAVSKTEFLNMLNDPDSDLRLMLDREFSDSDAELCNDAGSISVNPKNFITLSKNAYRIAAHQALENDDRYWSVVGRVNTLLNQEPCELMLTLEMENHNGQLYIYEYFDF